MSFANLFHISYFFDNNQTSTFFGFWPLVGILVLMIIVGYVVSAKNGKMTGPMKKVAGRIAHASILIGWLGLLWMFFRYQGVQYLQWRFWPAVMFIYLLWQIWLAIRYVKWEYPKKVAAKEAVGTKEVYLKKYAKRGR